MEKLSLQEFQKLKDRAQEIYQDVLPFMSDDFDASVYSEEEQNALEERFSALQEEADRAWKIMKQSDLSDIPFEAWEGYVWLVQDFDFEGTGANIDLSSVQIFDKYKPVRLKGCNVKNVDFDEIRFDEESFDEEFMEQHPDEFAGQRIDDAEAKDRYYKKMATIADVVKYQFTDKEIGRLARRDAKFLNKFGLDEVRKLDYELVENLSYDLTGWASDGTLSTPEDTWGATGEEKSLEDLILARIKYDIEHGDNLYRYEYYAGIPFLQEKLSEYIVDFGLELPKRGEMYSYETRYTPEERKRADILSNFKSRYLKLNDVLLNYELFQEKKYTYSLYENVHEGRNFTEEEIADFYEKHGDVIAIVAALGERAADMLETYRSLPEEEKEAAVAQSIKSYIGRARSDALKRLTVKDAYVISKYFEDLKDIDLPNKYFLQEILLTHSPEELEAADDVSLQQLDTRDLEEIQKYGERFGSYQFVNIRTRNFINRYTMENVVALERETDGMFTKLLEAIGDDISYQLGNEELDEYEDVEEAFANIIKKLEDRKGFNYGNFRGAFAERHPEMYLPADAPSDLAQKYYTRTLTFQELRDNPEWRDYFSTTKLSTGVSPHFGYITKDKDNWSYVNLIEYLENTYPKEDVLKFVTDFSVILDNKTINLSDIKISENMSWEEVKASFYENFSKQIRDYNKYDETLPQDFKDANADMFLSENIPEDVRNKIYNGSISLDDIRNVPGLYEELKTKDSESLMKLFFFKNSNMHQIKNLVGQERFLDLAYKYGYYMEKSEVNIQVSSARLLLGTEFDEKDDFEEIEKQIQQKIYEKVVQGSMSYGPDAPDFLKELKPDFFLDDDAPELLKISFYSRYTSNHPDYPGFSASNYGVTFKSIKDNPEWVEFLRGKALHQMAYSKQKNMYRKFDFDTILKFIDTDVEALTMIVDSNAVDRFFEFYNEQSEYFAWKEMKDLEGIPQEVSAPAVLGTEPVTPEQIEAKKMFDKKVEKFKLEILRSPGVFLDYPEDKLSEFNFGEFRDLKNMSGFKNSPDYRRSMEENIIAHMYGFLGYSEAKKMLQLPNLSTEEIERLYDNQRASFDAVYEKRFKLKGNVKVLNSFFEKFEATLPGGKPRLNIYKAFNKRLEEGYEGDLEALLLDCFKEAGIKPSAEKIKLCTENAESVQTAEKMSFAREEMYSRINLYVQENPADKKILFDNLFAGMKECLSKNKVLDRDYIEQYLKAEFSRVKDDGSSFYSQHVTEHIPELLKIVDDFNNTPEISTVINASVIDLLKTEKQKIGNNWIRKARTISDNLTLEELEELEERLYGESGHAIEYTKNVELRNNTPQGRMEAYELLKKDENPMLLTYAKAEKMFNSLTGPYSKAFAEFFVKHKEEFMSDPKYYTILKKMNDNFDSIMEKPHNKNRAAAGKFTVAELERVVNNIRYENVQEGEYELEYAARLGGLNPQYFKIAQRLFSEMQERSYQTIPQTDITRGRFRGRILRLDDPLHLMVGDITDCCQAIGTHAGEASMIHSATEKNGSVFVIEEYDEHGNYVNTVAQSWTWRNGDRICFDNVEIPDSLEEQYVQNGTHNELFAVYREAAKTLLENDRKAMTALLESGRITKAQYDILVLKDVTMGIGCDDLVKHLTGEAKSGLKNAKIVKPVEAEKLYNGVQTNKSLWIDSKSTQYIVASMEPEEREKLTTKGKASIEDIPLQYTRTREMIARKGNGIHSDILKAMKDMKTREGDTSSYIIREEIDEVEGIIATEGAVENSDDVHLNMNTNEDWFILSTKAGGKIKVLDTSLTTGKYGTEAQQHHDQALAKLEYGQAMQRLILEAADTEKQFECTIDEGEKSDIFRNLASAGIISIVNGSVSLLDREALVKKIDEDREKIEKDTVERNLADTVKPEEASPSRDKDDGDER